MVFKYEEIEIAGESWNLMRLDGELVRLEKNDFSDTVYVLSRESEIS